MKAKFREIGKWRVSNRSTGVVVVFRIFAARRGSAPWLATAKKIFGAPPPKTASSHEIGESVDNLSVQELDERILALQAEIIRLEETRKTKQASLSVATAYFEFDPPG